ncbi:MAG: DUF3667 domain-containing protein [Bacteroidota bacterium]
MKIRRKTNECPNCKALLDEVYNYCPICGQENTDNTVSFNMLVADFFNTFFALDSKFAKSVKPFLFQPGFLTNQYLNGKRMTFAHPLRFYLIISLFFFFVFTIVTKKSVEDTENKEGGIVRTTYNLKNIDGLDEVEIAKLRNTLGKDRIKTIEQDMNGGKLINVQKALERNLTEKEKEELLAVLDSSALRALKFIPELTILDSLKNIETPSNDMLKVKPDTTSIKEDKADDSLDINLDGEDHNIFNVLGMIDFEKINELKNDLTITDNQIYDSLNLKNLSSFEEHIVRQSIRVNRTDETLFAEFIAKNLPLMMLLLIPIFAIVLKLLYIRRKHLYITHLIHALHLHTFAYFLYGASLIAMLNIDDEDYASYVGFGAFLIVSTYAFISFLRVYKQHWFKTLVKFNLTGAIYVTCIFVFFLVELVISFLLF